MRDVSEIEKLIIEMCSIPIALIICGSIIPEVRKPIESIVSKAYVKVHPEVRKPIESIVSRVYENAKMTGKSIIKFLYRDNSPLYCL